MPVRVLVVDDSGFFRRRVKEMLGGDKRLEVVGEAVNGQEAVELAAKLRPDIITMDIEMPVMDGITAVKKIMAAKPVPILMFSSLTTDGAKATLDALEAGAVDYLPKRFEDISRDRAEATKGLCERVYAIGSSGHAMRRPAPTPPSRPAPAARPAPAPRPTGLGARPGTTPATRPGLTPAAPAARPVPAAAVRRGNYKLVAIGTSTGGPVALQEVLTKLPASFSLPILLIQHMPGSFTPAFAQRLNQLCQIEVREAVDGDALKPGVALLAPGGRQMLLETRGGRQTVKITDIDGQNYKPAVDLTFGSIAKVYPANTLAVIMTGMGADGREGARELKRGGSTLWSQDEASCVVYGMPAAVAEAGLSDQVMSLTDIGPNLAKQA